MDKRRFLTTTALISAVPFSAANAKPQNGKSANAGPMILTITGAISKTNRPGLDPALDQLFVKHKVSFDKARVLSAHALAGLPSISIHPTIEYDEKPHKLSGPLLSSVVGLAGVSATDKVNLLLKALDGYTVTVSLSDANKFKMIVATHMDEQPLAIGGLGPLWAVYEADKAPDMQDKPLNQRFGLCPWGLYHIEVKAV